MKFLRMKALGCLNSFRQPDFHTYHKTLPLPPKTTVAGMLGGALGISPQEVNEKWLKSNRFQMGIIGSSAGKANDLWQIRKYEGKRIAAYQKGEEKTPYKTAVIVRELLYQAEFVLYLTFSDSEDFALVRQSLENPAWALSLGREDELIKVIDLQEVELTEVENAVFQHTTLPIEAQGAKYSLLLEERNQVGKNLLNEAPKQVNLPTTFTHKKDSEAREAQTFQAFLYVSSLPIIGAGKGFFDEQENLYFQIF